MIFWIVLIICLISNIWGLICTFGQTFYEHLFIRFKTDLVKKYKPNDDNEDHKREVSKLLNAMELHQKKSLLWAERDSDLNKRIAKISFWLTISLLIIISLCHIGYLCIDAVTETQEYFENITYPAENPSIIEFNKDILSWNKLTLWLKKANDNIYFGIFIPDNVANTMHTVEYISGG